MKEYIITAAGLTGRIYQTQENEDRYSFELGGFYNWHKPLAEVIPQAKQQMYRVAGIRIEQAFKKLKQSIKTQTQLP